MISEHGTWYKKLIFTCLVLDFGNNYLLTYRLNDGNYTIFEKDCHSLTNIFALCKPHDNRIHQCSHCYQQFVQARSGRCCFHLSRRAPCPFPLNPTPQGLFLTELWMRSKQQHHRKIVKITVHIDSKKFYYKKTRIVNQSADVNLSGTLYQVIGLPMGSSSDVLHSWRLGEFGS